MGPEFFPGSAFRRCNEAISPPLPYSGVSGDAAFISRQVARCRLTGSVAGTPRYSADADALP
jgi:hypothetical protein